MGVGVRDGVSEGVMVGEAAVVGDDVLVGTGMSATTVSMGTLAVGNAWEGRGAVGATGVAPVHAARHSQIRKAPNTVTG